MSTKIAAPILAKQAAIPAASSPSQAAEGKKKKRKRNKNKKKHAEKEKQPERLSEKAGRKKAEEAPNEEDEDVITLEVTPEEMHEHSVSLALCQEDSHLQGPRRYLWT